MVLYLKGYIIMKVDIYKINHSRWNYILVQTGADIGAIVSGLDGFRGPSPSYRKIWGGPHDTTSPNSALNSDSLRTEISAKKFKFVSRVRKS
jgi:hypothetical protein